MAKVIVGMTVSLGGLVNDRNGRVVRLPQGPDGAVQFETINVLKSRNRTDITFRVAK